MNERHEQILEFLKNNNLVTVSELVAVTNASPATIRRDLIMLDQMGLVDRVHGSVTLSRTTQTPPTTSEKASRHHHEKELIGAKAAAMIGDGNSVVLDAGTTTIEIARNLRDKQIKVITPDLHIGILLSDCRQLSVAVTGGDIDWSSQSCIGGFAVDMMSRIHPDFTFVSCNAFSLESGITAPTNDKAAFKESLLRQSSKRVLVADSSKFGKTQLFEVAPLDSSHVNMLITDKALSDNDAGLIEARGIKVVRC